MSESAVRQPSRRPGPLRRRLRHLPSGLIGSGAVLVVATIVGALMRGGAGAVGAAAGVGLVAASYTLSSLVIAWADSIDPRLVLPAGLTTYAVKFAFVGASLTALAGATWVGVGPMACAVIATALAWTIAQAWWTWHAQIPYVELD